jgi:hypothetical protein
MFRWVNWFISVKMEKRRRIGIDSKGPVVGGEEELKRWEVVVFILL